MAVFDLWIDEDAEPYIDGLADSAGNYLDSATVTYALKDADGNTIAGGTGSYSYTAASQGDYTGVIDAAVTALLTDQTRYYLHVTGSQGNFNFFRKIPCLARYRQDT